MLTFLYHPIDPPRVIEEDEAEKMRATGVWFDCPLLAKQYRMKVEQEIADEEALVKKEPPKAKTKGK